MKTMTSPDHFAGVADDVRLWVYAFDNTLTGAQRSEIATRLEQFVGGWESHGTPVAGGYKIDHDRFVVLWGQCATGLSGCSIDASVRVFKSIKDELGLDALNAHLIHYRSTSGIESIDRPGFQELIRTGHVTADTIVFDTIITTVGAYRHSEWEKPVRISWHADAFQL